MSAIPNSLEVIQILHKNLTQWATPQFSILYLRSSPITYLRFLSKFLSEKLVFLLKKKRDARISEVTRPEALVTTWN